MVTVNASTVKSFRCFVVRKGDALTIQSPSREKTIGINLNLVRMSGKLSDEEQGLLDRLLDGLVDNIEDRADLTVNEMHALVSVKNKVTLGTNGQANGQVEAKKANHVNETSKLINAHQTGKAVQSIVNTVNRTEQRILGLQKVIDIYAGDFYQVEYDIPTVIQKKTYAKGGVDNPSSWFWAYAMRLTNSCWVFPESSFRNEEVAQWMDDARHKGCKIRVIKYAKDQIEVLKQYALEELRLSVVEYHTGLINNIVQADTDLEEARKEIAERVEKEGLTELAATASEKEREDYRNNRVRKHLANAIERLDVAIKSAELFDMTENVRDLFSAFKDTIVARAQIFNAMATERRIKSAPMPK